MALDRNIIKHTSIYSASRILEKAVSFLLLPFYAYIFETEGYGVIGMVDAAISLLTVAFGYGFHHAIVRIYYDEPEDRRRLVISTATLLTFGLGAVVMPWPMLASPWLARVLLGDSQYTTVLILAIVTVLVGVGGKAASAYLVIRQKSVLYSVVGILQVFLGIGLNVFLVLVAGMGLVGIFVASLITTSVATAIFVWSAIRHHGFQFDRDIARKLLAFQGPLLPAEVFAFFSRQAERFLVRFQIGLPGVGVLEMAYKFPPLLNLFFVMPFMLAWRTRCLSIASDADAPRAIGRMLTQFTFVLLLCALVLAVTIRPLLMLLTPAEFWTAIPIAMVDIVTTVLAGLTTFMEFGMMFRHETGRLAAIRTVVAAVKVGVSVVLITEFGLAGAAYSAAIMEATSLWLIAHQSQRAFRIDVEWGRLAMLAAASIVVFFGVQWVEQLPNGPVQYVASQLETLTAAWAHRAEDLPRLFGRIVRIVLSREISMAALIVNALVACSFGLMMFVIRPQTAGELWGRVRRLKAASPVPSA